MSDDFSIKVVCTDCSAELPSAWAHQSAPENPCPKCGSVKRSIDINIVEDAGLEFHDGMRLKSRDVTLPSKKNPKVDIFSGADLRKSDNTWMSKERVIDKDRDLYRETVIDPKTGEVIRQTYERLSDHQGHGSAKTRPPKT